ncbi:hypothetical protein ACFVU3_37385 [Streptomyces sp. NPDC058052]|uniref:hypothetical protein n=1 Tax=Streptomyces sp. NPDC058052 TaxID=3346316 RepID=UPI0036E2B924
MAQALRTSADPLLELRTLACAAGDAPAVPVTARSERVARLSDFATVLLGTVVALLLAALVAAAAGKLARLDGAAYPAAQRSPRSGRSQPP